MHEHAPPIDVLSAQVDRGFAFVPEGACEMFLSERKKETPEGSEKEVDRKTTLTLACISAIKPAMTAEQVSQKVNQAFLAEHPDCYATLLVDEDDLSDVVDKGEAKKMAQYTAQVQKSKAQKALVMQTRDKFVEKYSKRASQPKWSAAQKKQPRWLPEQDKAATSVVTVWIEKHCPPDVTVQCDDYNGRWRVIAPTFEWKSISWTKRGHERAAMEVIHQAWVYQGDWNGLKSPFNLDELAKTFLD